MVAFAEKSPKTSANSPRVRVSIQTSVIASERQSVRLPKLEKSLALPIGALALFILRATYTLSLIKSGKESQVVASQDGTHRHPA